MRTVIIFNLILLVLTLSGCAAQHAYRDGQHLYETGHVEEGLAEIERAYKLDPGNSEYRIQYFKLRERIIFNWLTRADAAKNNAAWEEAGSFYKSILKIHPDNARAKVGLSSLNTEKMQSQLLVESIARLDKDDLSGAAKNIHQILVESPSHPEALRLQKIIDVKLASRNQSDVILKSKLDRPITIEFKDSSIRTIFDFISKVSGTNFIFDKEVRSDLRATISLRDARIEDAIRFLLMSNQLSQRILDGKTLYIYPNTPQKLKEFQEMRVKNFYLANASAKDVAAMLKSIVKTKDLYVDEKANLIVMRDSPDVIRVAEKLVAAQDIAEPETLLDVEVLEVGTSLLETIGLQYPTQLGLGVVGAAKVPGTVSLSELRSGSSDLVNVTISNPALVLNMLHQDGDTNLLANPKIRVKNREKASVHIGDKVPVISNVTTATGLVSQSITYLDVGLKLDVEPTVYLENDVGIKVGLEVSNITNTIQNTNGSLTYQLGSRSANTVLRLKDGETQMLAGLISREDRKTSNGIPGLGQLPIIGRLFSSKTESSTKTEVVLLITPHVVRNIVRPESSVEEFSSGTEMAVSIDRMEINTVGSEKILDKVALISKNGEAPPLTGNKMPVPSTDITPEVIPAVLRPNSEIHTKLPMSVETQLTLDCPEQVKIEKDFAVKVNLIGSGVQKISLDFSFDPTRLKVVSVIEGDVHKVTNGNTQFKQQVFEKTGRVNLGLIGKESMQDKGTIATIIFQPLASATGKTELRVGSAYFSAGAGYVSPVTGLPAKAVEIVN